MRPIFSIALLALALQACSSDPKSAPQQSPSDPGTPSSENSRSKITMPPMTLLAAAGNILPLKNFAGKKVFVNLWASWCPPCRQEMPSIERLYGSVDTSRVAFVLLSLDQEFASAKAYVAGEGLQLPIYYSAGMLPRLFNTGSIPTTFLFDEQGTLIRRIDGSEDYDSDTYRALLK